MTKRRIALEVKCGEKTCFGEPGKPCAFLRRRYFGMVYFCAIWYDTDQRGKACPLEEKGGWLLRRPECLEAEVNNG